MKAGINYVMIKSPRTRSELLSGIYKNRDGTLYISDATHNKPNQSGAHKCQYGEVIDVGVLYPDKMKWETTNELQTGDTAVYYFNDDAWNKGRYYEDGEDIYFFIRYENIYFVIRDEKILPVNGYVLVEPTKIPTTALSDWIDGYSKTYGIVRHVGKPLISTKITGKWGDEFADEAPRLVGASFTDEDIKVGDFVFYPRWCSKESLYPSQNITDKLLYCMHRFGIWCAIDDPSKITLKENYKEMKHETPNEMTNAEFEQAQAEWARQEQGKQKAKTLYFT